MSCIEAILTTFAAIFGIAFLAFLYRWFIQGRSYRKPTRLDGKVVIITGANTGIGKETAVDLARRGARVYMACRSPQRGEEALQEVIERSRSTDVHFRPLDLASLKSVRSFAESFLAEEKRLDILINNAGIMACPKYFTEDGFEMQIGVNHMGHFLLTNLLLDLIKKSVPSRIVNVSSMAHQYGKINKEDLNSEKSYSPIAAYNQSKLANVMFTRELAKRLEGSGVSVYSLHPGVINTELGRHLGDSLCAGFSSKIIKPISWTLNKTPKAGAQTTITCAVDPDLEHVTGEYFS